MHRLHANVTPFYMKGFKRHWLCYPRGTWTKLPWILKDTCTFQTQSYPQRNWTLHSDIDCPFHCLVTSPGYSQFICRSTNSNHPGVLKLPHPPSAPHFSMSSPVPSRHCPSLHNPVSTDLAIRSYYKPYCAARWIKSYFPGIQSWAALKQPT